MKWVVVVICIVGGIINDTTAVKRLEKGQTWVSGIFRGSSAKLGRQSGCTECQCGVAGSSRAMTRGNRIVDGIEVPKNKYPWMVAIMEGIDTEILCGGSLVTDEFVLTAAHCDIIPKDDVRVRVGAQNLKTDTDHEVFQVSEIIKHENYDTLTNDNDIALYKLNGKVDMTKYRTICLPPPDNDFVGVNAIAIGWGRITGEGPTSDYLREANLPVTDQKYCRRLFGPRVTDNMLCAGHKDQAKDACQNDSGGPLMMVDADSSKHKQIGIVSFGSYCGIPGVPGVYTKVNNYLDWIRNKTTDSCSCST